MIYVFLKAFRDSRRAMLWMAFGLGLYIFFVMAFYPTMQEQAAEIDKMMESYPKEMRGVIYGDDAEDASLTEPGRYIGTYFMRDGLVLLGALVIVQAFNSITNAERDGSLDVMLSLPVSRRRYLLGRIANSVAVLTVILTVSFLCFWGSTFIWSEFEITVSALASVFYGALFPLMVIIGFAYMLAVLSPSSKHFAGPVAYLFLIGAYLLYVFSIAIEQLKDLQPVFLFHYYKVHEIVRDGINLKNWLVLGVVALMYLGIAWWYVDKKELGV